MDDAETTLSGSATAFQILVAATGRRDYRNSGPLQIIYPRKALPA